MKSELLKATLSAPVTVTWEITRACNLSCAHCLSDSGHGTQTPLADAAKTIDELASLGVFQINFGGGEPLMHSDVFSILERCVNRGVVTCMSTNGTLIKADGARRLAEMGIRIQVSLDGATEQTNDAIRGQGTFRRALRALEMLGHYQMRLAVNVVLTRLSFNELDNLLTLAQGFGAELRVSRLRPAGRARDTWETLRPRSEQLTSLRDWLGQHPDVLTGDSFFFLKPYGRNSNALDGCGAGSLTCCISPEGAVYPCAFMQWEPFLAGRLGDSSFAAIWHQSPVLAAARAGLSTCSACSEASICGGGCPAVAYGALGAATAIDPECPVGYESA